jgi:Uma2 family endonuclease
MAMPIASADWTVEMLDALPDDGNRYELIDGVLYVTPAPSDIHQLVVGALYARLRAYMRPGAIGRVVNSPADVRKPDRRRNRVQPDIFVVRLTDNRRPAYPFDLSDLLLVIEVESPGNAAYDYRTKRALYLDAGLEYWIVNSEAQTIARWFGSETGEILTARLEWLPEGMRHPFTLDLAEFFEDALG